MLSGVVLSPFREMHPKVCINDSVYKVFKHTFSDVADCCVPIGKTTFADVAEVQQVLLET